MRKSIIKSLFKAIYVQVFVLIGLIILVGTMLISCSKTQQVGKQYAQHEVDYNYLKMVRPVWADCKLSTQELSTPYILK